MRLTKPNQQRSTCKTLVVRERRESKTNTYLEVEVKLDGVDDRAVNDEPSRAVLTLPVALVLVPREEPDMMSLSDNNDRDLGVDFQLCASG